MTMQKAFLALSGVCLVPIALTYGAAPSLTLPRLFDIAVDNVNSTHVFRAVMGLYLGLAAFWITGSMRADLRIPALWSLVIFMFGLAGGRFLSLVLDGTPHWLLFAYMLIEFAFGLIGIRLIRATG